MCVYLKCHVLSSSPALILFFGFLLCIVVDRKSKTNKFETAFGFVVQLSDTIQTFNLSGGRDTLVAYLSDGCVLTLWQLFIVK